MDTTTSVALPIATTGPEWDAARCVQARYDPASDPDTYLRQYHTVLRPCLDQYRRHLAAATGTPIEAYRLSDDDRARVQEHISATTGRVAAPRPMRTFDRDAWRFPTSLRRIHCYLVPDDTDPGARGLVNRYVDRVREHMTAWPSWTPTPDPWRHVTVAWTRDPDADPETVAAAVAEAVADIPPEPIRLGPAIAADTHLRLTVADGPDATFSRLEAACLRALESVTDAPAAPGGDPQPHMTLGYTDTPGPDRWTVNNALADALRHNEAEHLYLRPARLLVVDGHQHPDATNGALTTWRVIARIPLRKPDHAAG